MVCHFHVFFLVEHSDMHSICLSCCSPVAAHSGARAHKQSERTKRSKRAKRKQALSSERGKLLHNPIPNLHFPLGKSRLLYSNVRTKDSISSSNTSSLFTLNAATRTNAATSIVVVTEENSCSGFGGVKQF